MIVFLNTVILRQEDDNSNAENTRVNTRGEKQQISWLHELLNQNTLENDKYKNMVLDRN